jgi:NAD(P)-dependent dehydrogenase (short-subunit alcohol dehydrogenase family)
MARIFITGSADGLGFLAAKELLSQGHDVVLHVRNAARGQQALERLPGASTVLVGDLSDIEQTKRLSDQANKTGNFDAVIHNAGVYQSPANTVVAVNVLAPYILTCLMQKPKRLIYLSSGLHRQGKPKIENLSLNGNGISYSDSKLQVLMLAQAAARLWPDVYSNAVDPGWVPTKMGGRNAPDDLQKGFETQVWLAAGEDSPARVSGRYFFHKKETSHNPIANDVRLQEALLKKLQSITGVTFGI